MDSIEINSPQPSQSATAEAPRPIAPLWHTIILIAGIAALSVEGAREMSGAHATQEPRLLTYASTAISQLLMLGWVYLGLRLRKVPFRSVLGDLSGGVRSFFLDIGIAAAFWIGSLVVLGSIGITWTVIDLAIHHRALLTHGKPIPPDPAQQHLIHTLSALAPSTGWEILAWGGMCMLAGFVEEFVFRGYFQRQFTAWGRGAVAAGVVFSSLLFGAAHGYQGVRNMILLSIFGSLFSLLVVFRRNLRAGMFAHAWHDFFVGLLLAAMRWKHLI